MKKFILFLLNNSCAITSPSDLQLHLGMTFISLAVSTTRFMILIITGFSKHIATNKNNLRHCIAKQQTNTTKLLGGGYAFKISKTEYPILNSKEQVFGCLSEKFVQ